MCQFSGAVRCGLFENWTRSGDKYSHRQDKELSAARPVVPAALHDPRPIKASSITADDHLPMYAGRSLVLREPLETEKLPGNF
ncbi:hypothetical protein EVAR_63879_1 [Eumeta japonica]|uniref:Uncharacterized protein n=1 Tax=Eumeta variegata TaxID=151549 RepID=A0A4C1ZYD0_EUMVA|nr:hypothetical protein EVAR_63879_1 [Eumeta japonica]